MRPLPCSYHLLKWIKAHLFFVLVFFISIRFIIPNFNSYNIFRISFSVILEFILGIHKLGLLIGVGVGVCIIGCCVFDFVFCC